MKVSEYWDWGPVPTYQSMIWIVFIAIATPSRKAAEQRKQKEVLGAVDILNGFLRNEEDPVKPPDHILRALKDLSEFLEGDRRQ